MLNSKGVIGHFRVPFASVSKRVQVRNLSYENQFSSEVYVNANLTHCTWTRFETEAEGNWEVPITVKPVCNGCPWEMAR